MNHFILQEILTISLSPSHLLTLVGLGLLIGQQGTKHLRPILIAFLFTLTGGLLLTRFNLPMWNIEGILLLISACSGILLAWRPTLPSWILVLLAAMSGLLLGLNSSPSLIPGMQTSTIYLILLGVLAGMTLALLLLILLGFALRILLNGLVLRIIGSWVAASALMVLALMLAR